MLLANCSSQVMAKMWQWISLIQWLQTIQWYNYMLKSNEQWTLLKFYCKIKKQPALNQICAEVKAKWVSTPVNQNTSPLKGTNFFLPKSGNIIQRQPATITITCHITMAWTKLLNLNTFERRLYSSKNKLNATKRSTKQADHAMQHTAEKLRLL